MNPRRLLALVFVTIALAACRRSQPNVLLITFDTTRADHMGYATGRPGVTPTLDELSRKGTWFSSCITGAPLTLPSHTSIMTGEYPFHHGVRNNGTYVVPQEDVTLAERLKAKGYATHAIVSAFVLDKRFGLDQGFDQYDDDLSGGPKQKMFMFKEISAKQTADKAISWLKDRPKDKPFFLWTHFFSPHADYNPPPDVAAQFPEDAYRGEIAFADRELGRVLETLKELKIDDNTIVIFTSDHGESLGEHGEKTHGIFVYDGTARVPLLFVGPNVPKGHHVDSVVRSIDITPTLLDLLGMTATEKLDGHSLEALWNGEKEPERVAYTESFSPRLNFGWSELRSLRTATMKVIDAPRQEVYDLRADPQELQDLEGQDPAGARPLFKELAAIKAADPFTHGKQKESPLDQESRQKLAALGYIWSAPAPAGPLPDPKDRIQYWDEFERAQQMIRDRQFDQAVTAIEALLKVDSENVIAMGSLANALTRTQKTDEALAVFQRMIQLEPAHETAYLGAARIYQKRKQYGQAIPMVNAVLKMQPRNPEGYTAMGDIYLDQNQGSVAEQWFRKAIVIDPHASVSLSGLGNCLNREGKVAEAKELLGNAVRQDPTSQVLVYNLAVVTERAGDQKGALDLYNRSLKIDADHSMTWNNLGSLLDRMGHREQATACVMRAHDIDPDNTEATYNLGALLVAQKRAAEAIPLLETALKQQPDLLQAAVQLARALNMNGQREQSLFIWNRLAPAHPAAYLQIARIQLEMGNEGQARAALKQGLAKGGDKFSQAVQRDEKLKRLVS